MATRQAARDAQGPGTRAGGGSAHAETVKRLRLSGTSEALLCVPAAYADLRAPSRVVPAADDDEQRLYLLQFTGSMRAFDQARDGAELDLARGQSWRWARRLDLGLVDEAGCEVTCSFFSGLGAFKDLAPGEPLPLIGRIERRGRRTFLRSPATPPAHAIGRIWAKYLGIAGRVSGEKVDALVRSQLDNPDAYRFCAARLCGELGMEEAQALQLAGASEVHSFEQLLRNLHQPRAIEDGWMARALAQKLSAMAVQSGAIRRNLRQAHPKAPIGVDPNAIEWLARTQREQLSQEQREVASTVLRRLASPKPLNALLSGDVGTGKTLTFLLPAVAAHRAGAKVAIIAPTSILADQLADELGQRFGQYITGFQRVQAGGRIADQQAILVGTSGLANAGAREGFAPNLLICDEQHKFGAAVREKLIKPWTHVLDVSATPVPRSLASAMFGGKEILNLRKCPVQKKIHSEVGDRASRPRYAAMLKWAIETGQRAAVVYPLVQASRDELGGLSQGAEGDEVASVTTGARALEEAFPGRVVALHSKLSDSQIAEGIQAVKDGTKPLLVASVLIEIGINIPSMAVMIVRDADRFGASQLHQLRGRLVRTGGEGHFAMMVNDLAQLDPETHSRLEAVASTTDGFVLAEKDMASRGFGDLDGTAQSGASDTVFRLVGLRPEDFLRKKLTLADVAPRGGGRDASASEDLERERVVPAARQAGQGMAG